MVKIHEMFKTTMDRYGIKGRALASIAGVSAQHITEFRQGRKWVSEDTFEALLEGIDHLSPGSKKYFCELLVSQKITEMSNKEKLMDLIENANEEEIEVALLAIGRKWKSSKNTEKDLNNHTLSSCL
ncbi:XRE family transcriptional regulator [Nodularia sphaerocarpa]|uniref:XRE family transcriptional regulator n=1 Tax=Nodularia sphaerocarpa TaxID=137816 RepID=UPI00232F4B82|nr:XRE family transcriptional regulator [Nodularia sphaerocarpa]MDB9372371.1 XRE family transcriptional regulator [Nodularia sphaerocarpa CS-585]MDB9377987.1 XRE family transcriptional regulator [Nodularia sphaerocarpa CS-585A2]